MQYLSIDYIYTYLYYIYMQYLSIDYIYVSGSQVIVNYFEFTTNNIFTFDLYLVLK